MPCPECRAQTGSDHRYCAYCGFPLRPETLASDHHLPPGEAACERWQKVAARYPDRPEAHYNLGIAHYHLGHIDDAIAAFERAVAIEDALPHAHFQLAVSYYRRGRLDDCAASCRRALQHQPGSVPARYRLALSLFHLGELDEALEHFREVVTADPGYVIAHYHMGVLYERLGMVDDAIEAFTRVADGNPDDAAAHYHLGVNYKHKGLDDLAIGEFAHVAEARPERPRRGGGAALAGALGGSHRGGAETRRSPARGRVSAPQRLRGEKSGYAFHRLRRRIVHDVAERRLGERQGAVDVEREALGVARRSAPRRRGDPRRW